VRGSALVLAASALLCGCTILASDEMGPFAHRGGPPEVRVARSTLALPGHGTHPTALEAYDPRVYEILLRLDGERARVLAVAARPDWAARISPPSEGGPQTVPAAATRMLSMADAAWRTPTTTGRHKSMFKETTGRRRVEAIRLVTHFSPKRGVRCVAQQKIFADTFPDGPSPGDAAVDAVWAEMGIEADDIPRIELPRSGGQLLLRLREGPRGAYVQELHVAYDYDAPREGETYEVAMMCRGPLDALTGVASAETIAENR